MPRGTRYSDHDYNHEPDYEPAHDDDEGELSGTPSGSDSPLESEGSCSDSDSPPPPKKKKKEDFLKITFCPAHKNDLVPKSCQVCRHVSRMLRDDVAKQVVVDHDDGEDQLPGPSTVFGRRCDEKEPTLCFSDDEMNIAKHLFTVGAFRDKKQFDHLVQSHLFLTHEQNVELHQNLNLEDSFKEARRDPAFNHIFHFQSMIVKTIKDDRIALRPLITAANDVVAFKQTLRGQGRALGLVYPKNPPKVELMGPQKTEDVLSYVNSDNVLPPPSLCSVLAGISGEEIDELPSHIVVKIRGNEALNNSAIEEFRAKAVTEFLTLYGNSSTLALKLQNKFHFGKLISSTLHNSSIV